MPVKHGWKNEYKGKYSAFILTRTLPLILFGKKYANVQNGQEGSAVESGGMDAGCRDESHASVPHKFVTQPALSAIEKG